MHAARILILGAAFSSLLAGDDGVLHHQLSQALGAAHFAKFKLVPLDMPRQLPGHLNAALVGWNAVLWAGVLTGLVSAAVCVWQGRIPTIPISTIEPIRKLTPCQIVLFSMANLGWAALLLASIDIRIAYRFLEYDLHRQLMPGERASLSVGTLHRGGNSGAVAGIVVALGTKACQLRRQRGPEGSTA